MKKVLSVFVLVLLILGVVGCDKKEERTYKADGVYMAYEVGTSTQDVLNADGTVFKLGEGDAEQSFKAVVPTITFVEVTIANDKIIEYNIDERQSKVYVGSTNEDGSIKGLNIKFNDKTKKQLGWEYNMNFASVTDGEWFLAATKLQDSWLELEEPAALASLTMNQDKYVKLAKDAIKNAKDGKAQAISRSFQNAREHYDYDFAFATADVDENGKLSNVRFDALSFGYNRNTFGEKLNTANNTYEFTWNEETKYENYGPMSGGKLWQDQIDALEEYIADNGWYYDLYSTSTAANAHKGVHVIKDGEKEVPEALASVTIEARGEITLLNTLNTYFPFGLKK